MTYGFNGFYPFHLGVFHVKIIVLLWLIYCFLVGFVDVLICLLNLFWHTKRERPFLESLYSVVFPNKVVSELGCLEFFLCAKMDDNMTKLNSMNYSTWKRMMEDFLYCKDLYKPIRLNEKPSDMLNKDWDIEHRKVTAYMRRWMDITLHEYISDETKAYVV